MMVNAPVAAVFCVLQPLWQCRVGNRYNTDNGPGCELGVLPRR